ncbi:RHS repeat domain-containing protein, partial [Bacteroides faecichinchillae]
LPDEVTFANGNSIRYEYAADGIKLRTVHKTGAATLTTDYCGNAVYENGVLRMLLNEAGYVSFPDKKFHFYLKDHQGNVRVVADKDGNVEETNAYYPFGGTFTSTNSVQSYKYNGKELDTRNGLNWYDYGARHYDATIGRWHVVDPMSEKYCASSLYNYCDNEPIGRIDFNGQDWYKRRKDKENDDDEWEYFYSTDIHSQKELDKQMSDGVYLGKTYANNNVYYSLFGSQKIADSFEGMIYQKIDEAIMKKDDSQIESSGMYGESIGLPRTDFSIQGIEPKESKYLGIDSQRNNYSIMYENSTSGVYYVHGKMIGTIVDWIGDSDMPKLIHGYFGDSKPWYHIRIMNKSNCDIIHLKYNSAQSKVLLDKYNKLFLKK